MADSQRKSRATKSKSSASQRRTTPTDKPIAPTSTTSTTKTNTNEQIRDPLLTKLGDEQCAGVRARFPSHAKLTKLFASPMRRTLYTCLQSFGPQADGKGQKAVIQYDYEKAEDNEIELLEGQTVTDIDMVDDDWWIGTNVKGERGLFPSNYVELVEETQAPAPVPPPVQREPSPPPPPTASRPAAAGPTATALYDYEAAEDNGKPARCDELHMQQLLTCYYRNQLPRRCKDYERRIPRR